MITDNCNEDKFTYFAKIVINYLFMLRIFKLSIITFEFRSVFILRIFWKFLHLHPFFHKE